MRDADLVWQIAELQRDRRGRAWLLFRDPGSCTRCERGTGCGAALFSRLFSRPDARLPAPDDVDGPPGAVFRVGVPARWLLLAAVMVYLVPVVCFVAGAVIAGAAWPGSDALALASGLASLALGAMLLGRPARGVLRPELVIAGTGGTLESGRHRNHLHDQRA